MTIFKIKEVFCEQCPEIAKIGWDELIDSGFSPKLRAYPSENLRYILAECFVDGKCEQVGVVSFFIDYNVEGGELVVDLAYTVNEYRKNKVMEKMHNYLIKLCYTENVKSIDYLVNFENHKMLNFQVKHKGVRTHATFKHKVGNKKGL